jgi:hypothetical protein
VEARFCVRATGCSCSFRGRTARTWRMSFRVGAAVFRWVKARAHTEPAQRSFRDHTALRRQDPRSGCCALFRRWIGTASPGNITTMGLPVSPSPRVSAAEREHLARRLRDACAEDRLSLQTFVHRLDLLYAARNAGELRALVADLPKPRPFERQVARLSGWAAECVTAWADAWGRATAERLLLPTEGSVVLGRSHDCSCVMSHPTVSRRHARLTHTQTGWTLRDLASSNGTYLNGARITETALVHPWGRGLARLGPPPPRAPPAPEAIARVTFPNAGPGLSPRA